MINPFKIKKWSALIIAGVIPSLFFMLIVNINGFLWAIGAMMLGILISLIIGTILLNNPFSDMLEGKGLLAINLSSTGILQFFILPFSKNFLKGVLNGEEIEAYFDRKGANVMNAPKVLKNTHVQKTDKNGLVFHIDENDLSDSRFAFNQYPVLIYNSMSGTFFSKEQLAEFEKKIISFDRLVFLTKKIEELTIGVKSFGRYIIDNLKPKKLGGGLPPWVLIILIMIVVGIIVMMLLKSGGGGAIGQAISGASNSMPTNPITPMG